MARQRTIKFPPKRGKLTIRQIEQAVDKVIKKETRTRGDNFNIKRR